MKNSNNKGFTLIELLAVIVIMGILMMVAIPSVSRVIENSRKDTFVDIAKSYANAARTLWTADGLTCNGTVSSALDNGNYFVLIDTSNAGNYPVLVDQGGKSSWGNRDVQGYVRINISTTTATATKEPKRVTKFYVALSDGTHGIIDDFRHMLPQNVQIFNAGTLSDALVRGNVKMDLTSEEKVSITSLFNSTPTWNPLRVDGKSITYYSNPVICVES